MSELSPLLGCCAGAGCCCSRLIVGWHGVKSAVDSIGRRIGTGLCVQSVLMLLEVGMGCHASIPKPLQLIVCIVSFGESKWICRRGINSPQNKK